MGLGLLAAVPDRARIEFEMLCVKKTCGDDQPEKDRDLQF